MLVSLLIHEELAELSFLDEILLDTLLDFVEDEDNLLDFFDTYSVLFDLVVETVLFEELSPKMPVRIKQIIKMIPSFLNNDQSFVFVHLKIR